MKRKGFTLIELIGVIVIMGLILLIVFPATVRLIKGNDEKKFNQYYELVEDAADLFAKRKKDDLGGVTATGCIDATVTDLIKEDYLKKFDEEGVICASPSELTLSEYSGIDASKNYVDIRIKNNKGKISSEISLVCVKNKKVVYQKLIEKTGTCDKYVAEVKNALFNDISRLASKTNDNEIYFITGTNPNNYVYYSGKLWRAISYNNNDKTIKLVSDEVVTYISYNVSLSDYVNSNVDVFLTTEFLSTLRSPDQYLLNSNWNYTTVANANKPADTNITQSKVGLLNLYEFENSKEFLQTNYNWWLLSKSSPNNLWYVTSTNTSAEISAATFLGVRPSIVLKPNITYIYGGMGTKDNPYRLDGDNYANPGTLLNTRYAGEYVTFKEETYRIQKTDAFYTRLVSNNVTSTSVFDAVGTSSYNAGTTIGINLNETWYNSLSNSDKMKLTSADFCTSIVTNTTKYSTTCNLKDTINLNVGLPRLGDLYAVPNASGSYWTLSNATDETINVIATNGDIEQLAITEERGVKPVININSNVKISGGNGTSFSPYTLE